MVGYGTHEQPAGTFSDDTSMTLATCDSLLSNLGVDIHDLRSRFLAWMGDDRTGNPRGAYSADDKVFDVGNTTGYQALISGHGLTGLHDNGNGSLMRILPLAYTNASNDVIAEVSAITHAHQISIQACITYAHIARAIIRGMAAREAVNAHADEFREARLHDIWELAESSIRSTGYVVDTLEAAL